MKAAPPFWPTMYGKRQMLPRPMAEPALAMIAVKRLLKLPLSLALRYRMKLVKNIRRTAIGATHLIRK